MVKFFGHRLDQNRIDRPGPKQILDTYVIYLEVKEYVRLALSFDDRSSNVLSFQFTLVFAYVVEQIVCDNAYYYTSLIDQSLHHLSTVVCRQYPFGSLFSLPLSSTLIHLITTSLYVHYAPWSISHLIIIIPHHVFQSHRLDGA